MVKQPEKHDDLSLFQKKAARHVDGYNLKPVLPSDRFMENF
jgi:hypothetical protein